MPQIAQQDYLYIKPVNAPTVSTDAAALGQLRRALDNGTIADCLIYNARLDDGAEDPNVSKVLSYYSKSGGVCIYDLGNGEIATIEAPYTEQQYEGLAAIQREEKLNLQTGNVLPSLVLKSEGINDDENNAYITVNNHFLIPDVESGEIIALSLGEDASAQPQRVEITWEDAQKLIGLPITNQ